MVNVLDKEKTIAFDEESTKLEANNNNDDGVSATYKRRPRHGSKPSDESSERCAFSFCRSEFSVVVLFLKEPQADKTVECKCSELDKLVKRKYSAVV